MDCFRLGKAVIEPSRNRITCDSESHRVTRRDMEVLMCLVRSGTQVVHRDEVIESVWKDIVVNEEVLTLSISRLRRVFSDNPKSPQLIETIPKKGYRLMLPSRSCEEVQAKVVQSDSRRSKMGIGILVALLLIFASLYVLVRIEYQRVTESAEQTIQTTGSSQPLSP